MHLPWLMDLPSEDAWRAASSQCHNALNTAQRAPPHAQASIRPRISAARQHPRQDFLAPSPLPHPTPRLGRAGARPPAKQPIDGLSLADVIRGKQQPPLDPNRFMVTFSSRDCIDPDFVPLLGPDRWVHVPSSLGAVGSHTAAAGWRSTAAAASLPQQTPPAACPRTLSTNQGHAAPSAPTRASESHAIQRAQAWAARHLPGLRRLPVKPQRLLNYTTGGMTGQGFERCMSVRWRSYK